MNCTSLNSEVLFLLSSADLPLRRGGCRQTKLRRAQRSLSEQRVGILRAKSEQGARSALDVARPGETTAASSLSLAITKPRVSLSWNVARATDREPSSAACRCCRLSLSSVSEGERQRQRAERPRKEAANRKQREGRVQQQARLLLARAGAEQPQLRRGGNRELKAAGTRSKATVPSEAQGGTLTIAVHQICTKFGKPH